MTVFETIITAMFTGFGTAVGSYLATRGLVKNIEKVLKKERRK